MTQAIKNKKSEQLTKVLNLCYIRCR